MSRDWTFFLEDILEASKKVGRYTNGMTLKTFQSNELVFDAVVRNLEIIGEAAKHLPPEIHKMMPEVELSKAAAFRDVIAHGYFGLNVHINLGRDPEQSPWHLCGCRKTTHPTTERSDLNHLTSHQRPHMMWRDLPSTPPPRFPSHPRSFKIISRFFGDSSARV